jgi:hypothetical protein|tara:strand:+ start:275 stop:940 length:666 start_codon:yes stop_codon:yes gene_type:complete
MVNMFDRDTLDTIRRIVDNYPDRIIDVLNSINENQFKSKDWLIEKLNEYPHHFKYKTLDKKIDICLLASWYGLLAYRLIDKFQLKKINNIDCFDFDPKAKSVAKKLWKKIDADNLKNGKLTYVKFIEQDINDIKQFNYPVVILTSCEHLNQKDIDSIISKINEHTLIVLQSNNYKEINEHINCVDTKEDFANQYVSKLRNMKIYEKDFIKYKRFMIIGTKI